MNAEIIIAIISGVGTLAGSFAGIMASNRLTNYRIRQLEDKVSRHNNFAGRMPVVE